MLAYIDMTLRFEAQEQLELPSFTGSTLRGAFSAAFKGSACKAATARVCERECGLPSSCAYGFVMETPIPEDAPKRARAGRFAPHPLVLTPFEGGMFFAGDELEVGVRLFGAGRRHVREVVEAWARIGALGLGRGRGKMALYSVEDTGSGARCMVGGAFDPGGLTSRTLSPGGFKESDASVERVDVRFETPTQFIRKGELVRRPDFVEVVYQCASRHELLEAIHGRAQEGSLTSKEWSQRAREADVELESSALTPVEIERWSSRQNKKHPLRGVQGRVTFSGDIAPFLPILRAGEITCVGKGTSFGFGHMSVQAR